MANLQPPLQLTPVEYERLRTKYPSRAPVFMIRAPACDSSFPVLQKSKFLVPKDLTLGMFSYVVRKHMTLPPEKAMFFFIENVLPTTSSLIGELYHRYKSNDGALRIVYTSENTFG